jgi:hypothetical protein
VADLSVVVGGQVTVATVPGFKNGAGVAADPTTVRLRWKSVGGTEVVLTYGVDAAVVKDGTGVYHADITPVASGPHVFRWEGTGAVVAAAEGTFSVWTYF